MESTLLLKSRPTPAEMSANGFADGASAGITPDSRAAEQRHAVRFFGFPGGERHVALPTSVVASSHGYWEVEAHLYDTAGVMDLLLLHDALRRALPRASVIELLLPYVPYARQDRVANAGEPLSAAVFCGLINSMRFSTVTIADPHSDVVSALLDNVRVLRADTFVRQLFAGALAHLFNPNRLGGAGPTLVSPDAGARKRTEALSAAFKLPAIHAFKHRDTVTGRLSGSIIEGRVPAGPLVVTDDICDGGGTFLLLADALRAHTQQPLYLYVTHGLYTKGLDALRQKYAGIYCAYCANPQYRLETALTAPPPAA